MTDLIIPQTPGAIIPDEAIFSVILDAVNDVQAAVEAHSLDALLAVVLSNVQAAPRASFATYLKEHGIRVIYGWPREEQQFPCYAIIVDTDTNEAHYIGQTLGEETIDDVDTEIEGQRWAASTMVIAYAENVDLARWLAQFARYSLAKALRTLSDLFPHGQNLTVQSLRDEQIGARWVARRAVQHRGSYDLELPLVEDASDIEGIEETGAEAGMT
jgi:hypothetical protein